MALTFKQKEQLTELWKEWKKTKDPEILDEIFELVDPIVNYYTMQYANSGVSPAVIESEIQNNIVHGLQTYQPGKGSLPTYLSLTAQRVYRYVNNNQNIIRLPEKVRNSITQYNQVKEQLQDSLHREPTDAEIADEMGVPLTTILALKQKMSLTGSIGDSKSEEIPSNILAEVEIYLENKYSPLEYQMYEYAHGLNGKPKMKSTEISKKLGVSNTWISRHLSKMDEDARDYIRQVL